MSIPKEPRQIMINLMYLVLTALLALNVSAEILNAFHVVNRGITNSNIAVTSKNNQVMTEFNQQMIIQKQKTEPFYNKAIITQSLIADLEKKLDDYKTQIIQQSGGWTDNNHQRHSKFEDPEIGNWSPENGALWDDRNLDVSTRVMIDKKGGNDLKALIEYTRNKLLFLFDNDTIKEVFASQLPLRIDPPMKNENGELKSWQEANFQMVPTIAAITLLNKLKNDAMNSEMQILDYLYKSINAPDIKVDRMQACVIAPANYIMSGTAYKANILVAAYSTTNQPKVFIGALNANAQKDSTGTYYLKTNIDPVVNGKELDVSGGIAQFEAMASNAGQQYYSGAVLTKGPDGEAQYYPFEADYNVFSPAAVVSSDNLNLIYAGIINPFSVSVPGVSSENVSATISEGTLTKSGVGKYDAMLEGSSIGHELKITVAAKLNDGTTRIIAQLPFKVKMIPAPVATIAGKYENGGKISAGEMRIQKSVGATLRNFYFQGVQFNVSSFECIYIPKHDFAKAPEFVTGKLFNETVLKWVQNCIPGDKFIFMNINAIGPDKKIRPLNSIPLEIK